MSVRASVFFNEKQRLQRDLTTLALAVYAETTGAPPRSLAVLDALAASGVRGLRYALEVPAVGTAVLNDASDEAVAAMRENARLSGFAAARERGSYLHAGGARLEVSQGDAVALMRARRRHFDAVDLDPYGSVSHHHPSAAHTHTLPSPHPLNAAPHSPLASTPTCWRELCTRRLTAAGASPSCSLRRSRACGTAGCFVRAAPTWAP